MKGECGPYQCNMFVGEFFLRYHGGGSEKTGWEGGMSGMAE